MAITQAENGGCMSSSNGSVAGATHRPLSIRRTWKVAATAGTASLGMEAAASKDSNKRAAAAAAAWLAAAVLLLALPG